MDTRRTVSIDLPDVLLLALGKAARAAGCSPSDYLRAVLRGALDRTPARLRPEGEEVLRAAHLASGWVELQRRLRGTGVVLRRAPEGGLAVHSWPLESALMPLKALGLSEADLVLRYGAAFPAEARHPATAPERQVAGVAGAAGSPAPVTSVSFSHRRQTGCTQAAAEDAAPRPVLSRRFGPSLLGPSPLGPSPLGPSRSGPSRPGRAA